jgi:predicted RNase H-like nuclease (RuvC/YqgF family)
LPVKRLDEYLRRFSDRVSRGDVDVELALRRLVEAIVDEVARRIGSGGQAPEIAIDSNVLAEALEKALEPIRRELSELRREVSELTRLVRSLQLPSQQRQEQAKRVPRWLAQLIKELEDEGFKLASQLPREIVDSFDSRIAELHGIYSIGLEGDIAFVKKDVIQDLVNALSTIKVGDEVEVAAKLDGRLRRLFHILRRSGYLVYSNGWVPVGELKKIIRSSS